MPPNANVQESTDSVSQLRRNPLFSCLTDEQLAGLRGHASRVELREGEVLFNQGDPADLFYFVDKGLIKLYRHSVEGNEKIFELEKPGQVFAEALMFRGLNSYPVSAAAMQSSTVVGINNNRFLEVISESHETALSMMADLSLRLHQMLGEIDRLSLLNGRMRVAAYLLDQYLVNGREFTLEAPKNAIASMLALQPESFSRLLKELITQRVIRVKDHHFEILDDHLLRKRAGII